LRGHDKSEGEPVSAHFSEKYVIDTMNSISYLKNYEAVDEESIGYWGHSNGGEIGLRVILLSDDIKAASFWAGVVGTYEDMFETYNDQIPFLQDLSHELIQENGLPSENPKFWNDLEAHNYVEDISVPVEIQHSTGDEVVPIELSLSLKEALEENNKTIEYHEYQGGNHNISINSSLAWQRTIDFFNRYLED
jgi:dipeptidyl aminopeptidase/acylaminoacyl peptidase